MTSEVVYSRSLRNADTALDVSAAVHARGHNIWENTIQIFRAGKSVAASTL